MRRDMTTTMPHGEPVPVPRSGTARDAVVDVVIPVYNEETDLGPCVTRLHHYLSTSLPYSFQVTIVDNASTDGTPAVAEALSQLLPHVRVIRLDVKGRGHALKAAWSASTSPVLSYMDVDLSTDLAAVLPLLAPLISGHSDIAIGTRFAHSARVVRGLKREVISRAYNLILRATLAVTFSDAQCGFKAIRRDAAERLLPEIRDGGWFFDTELLVLAEQKGLRIHEVPVDWIDDPDSRVHLTSTAIADIRGIVRMIRTVARRKALPRQLLSFATIGVASTLAYLGLFALLRTGLDAQAANLVALLTTAVANTAANRRLTFGISGRRNAGRHQLQGLLVFGVGLALTSGCLAVLHLADPTASRPVELVVVTVANLAATVVRFVLMRLWLFADAPTPPPNR
jgi:glycosyltransferase involved in cell wall biosynthesis